MIRLLACLGAVALFPLATRAADPLEFKEHTSKDGRYKVLMPGKPESTEKKSAGLVVRTASVKLPSNHLYSVTYFDMAGEIPADESQKALKEFTSSVKGKLLSAKEWTFGETKLPSRETIFERDTGVHIRNFFVMDGRRVYQLIVAAPTKDAVTSKDADKFIDSFEITAPAAEPVEFKEYVSKEGGYKVLMPGKVETSKTKNGKTEIFSAIVNIAARRFTVAYSDLPAAVPAADAQEILQSAGGRLPGKKLSENEKSLGKDKIPAREFFHNQEDRVFLRTLVVLHGTRMYMVAVASSTKDDITAKDADKFFASFEITTPTVNPLELKEYVSKAGRYKILLPRKVETSEKKEDEWDTFTTAATPLVGWYFGVTYFDLKDPVPADQAQSTLKRAMPSDGKVLSETEKSLGKAKLPAREVLVESDGNHGRLLLVLDGQRVYRVILGASKKDNVTSKDADKFFESFEIVK